MKSEKGIPLFSLFIYYSSFFILYSSLFKEGCPQALRFCHSLALSFLLVRSK